jgi:hypothetical protein
MTRNSRFWSSINAASRAAAAVKKRASIFMAASNLFGSYRRIAI